MRITGALSLLPVVLLAYAGTITQAQQAVPDGFTFTAAGDLIGPYAAFPANDPGIAAIAPLFLHADLGFANQEGSMFDLATFRGFPAAENGGGTPVYSPEAARDLRAMGITLVSKANNHAIDWGTEGLEASLATLKAAGIVQAGSGQSLKEARAPGYVETPRGTAALVDTASTFPPMAAAADPFVYRGTTSLARPGISPLRVRLIKLISSADFAALRRSAGNSTYPVKGHDDESRIGDILFRASPTPGLTWEMQDADEQAILASVRQARANARFVLFSIHAHETASDGDAGPADFQPVGLHFANEAAGATDTRPADFEPALFHAAIDAGADAVVRTGPHQIGGIEIYKGKPIFYSLGSLFFPFGARRVIVTAAGESILMPDDYFETIIPVTTYRNSAVSEICIYPMVIERSAGPTLGYPHPATPEQSQHILTRLQALSDPFHTIITIQGNIGIIRLSAK